MLWRILYKLLAKIQAQKNLAHLRGKVFIKEALLI